MANRIKVLILKSVEGCLIPELVGNFEDTLENIYQALDCSCIDIQVRAVGNHRLEFVFDDEYIINGKCNKYFPTAILDDDQAQEVIFGAVMITGPADDEGNLTSLNDLEIEAITKSIRPFRQQLIEGGDLLNLNPIFTALSYKL